MNLDIDVLKATLGELVFQLIVAQSANKQLQIKSENKTEAAPSA